MGSARALPIPADCMEGPRPRIATFLGEFPVMMNPPIATLSPISTGTRVEMFNDRTGGSVVGAGVEVGVREDSGVAVAVGVGCGTVAVAVGVGYGTVAVAVGVGCCTVAVAVGVACGTVAVAVGVGCGTVAVAV